MFSQPRHTMQRGSAYTQIHSIENSMYFRAMRVKRNTDRQKDTQTQTLCQLKLFLFLVEFAFQTHKFKQLPYFISVFAIFGGMKIILQICMTRACTHTHNNTSLLKSSRMFVCMFVSLCKSLDNFKTVRMFGCKFIGDLPLSPG